MPGFESAPPTDGPVISTLPEAIGEWVSEYEQSIAFELKPEQPYLFSLASNWERSQSSSGWCQMVKAVMLRHAGVAAPPNYPAYAATKAGLIHLTRQLALDYGPDIRVNRACPRPIDTNRVREFPPRSRAMTDAQRQQSAKAVKALHRMGRPEEVAYAALFLASDESSFITGHALVIDGGQTIGV